MTTTTPSLTRLTHTILTSLGLLACGSEVTVYGGDGAGGHELQPTTDTTVGTSSGSGLGTACESQGGEVHKETVCPAGLAPACPDAHIATSDVASAVEYMDCQVTAGLIAITAGPMTKANSCCYEALVCELRGPFCGGRPFLVDGVARTAGVESRADWRAMLRPALPTDGRVREQLGQMWLQSALDEHASLASFARFVVQLLALGAPPELMNATHRAMNDEVVHAKLCFGLASAYGERAFGPSSLEPAPADATGRGDALASAVLEGCIGETISAQLAAEGARSCHDPVVRSVLTKLARDEEQHALLAWRFVHWARPQAAAGERADVLSMVHLTIAETKRALLAAPPTDGSLQRYGRFGKRAELQIALRTLEEVVLPCIQAVCGAREQRSA